MKIKQQLLECEKKSQESFNLIYEHIIDQFNEILSNIIEEKQPKFEFLEKLKNNMP